MTDDYKGVARAAAEFFKNAAGEFDSVASEIERRVEEHHVRRLRAVQTNAARYEVSSVESWIQERLPRDWMADEFHRLGNSYEEWESLHAVVHQMCIDLWDLPNLIDRLQDFVGMGTPTEAEHAVGASGSAWRSGSFYVIAAAALLVILALVFKLLLWSGTPLIPAAIMTVLLALVAVASVVVLGALQLSHDRRISDKALLQLVKLGLDSLRRAVATGLHLDVPIW